ncbi:uncharacterized protein LOC129794121 [Lutzomyia longipalpis]|uniref:uncharacterized protein LOC129794121 n=1 Tax=Lutzomyia longipalpis TaxID=7200 RepID=UPI0024838989|nr:uncharacterized protein LOC129794121 [Lutzomyia longipalpis]
MTILRVLSSGILLLTMGVTINAGNSKDRHHVKIHVPEIVKKHIHTRTIYKHHYHRVPMHMMPHHHHMGHESHLQPTFNLGPIHHGSIYDPVTGPSAAAAASLDVGIPWHAKPPQIIPVAPLPPRDPMEDTDIQETYSHHSGLDDSYEYGSDEEYPKNPLPAVTEYYEAYKPVYDRPSAKPIFDRPPSVKPVFERPSTKYRPPDHTSSYTTNFGHTGPKHPPDNYDMPKYTTPMSVTSTSYSHQLHYFPSAGEEDIAVPIKTTSKHPVWYMSSSGSDEHGPKFQAAKAMETDDFSHFDNILTTKPKSVITKYGSKVPLKELSEIRRRVRKHKVQKKFL